MTQDNAAQLTDPSILDLADAYLAAGLERHPGDHDRQAAQQYAGLCFIEHVKREASAKRASAASFTPQAQQPAAISLRPASGPSSDNAPIKVMQVEVFQGQAKNPPFKAFTKYTIHTDTGLKLCTFDAKLARIADDARANGQFVNVTFKSASNPKWGADLTGLTVVS